MAFRIGIIGQKGGVGKSTIARLIACLFASAGANVRIADFDAQQSTSWKWAQKRENLGNVPPIPVKKYPTVKRAVADDDDIQVLIFDGAGHASEQAKQIAEHSDVIILPTGTTDDDYEPTADLFDELVEQGISEDRIVAALARTPDSDPQLVDAIKFLHERGVAVLPEALPEQAGFKAALKKGKGLNETVHPTLNKQADRFGQAIIDHLQTIVARKGQKAA